MEAQQKSKYLKLYYKNLFPLYCSVFTQLLQHQHFIVFPVSLPAYMGIMFLFV